MSDKSEQKLPDVEIVYKAGRCTGSLAVEFTVYYDNIQYGSEGVSDIFAIGIRAITERWKRDKYAKALAIAERLIDEEEKERESGETGAYTRIVSMLSKKQADEG